MKERVRKGGKNEGMCKERRKRKGLMRMGWVGEGNVLGRVKSRRGEREEQSWEERRM